MWRRRIQEAIHSGPTAFAVIYVAAKWLAPALAILLLGRDQWDRLSADPEVTKAMATLREAILLAACAVYGFAKWHYHPGRRGPYVAWLRTTPWTSRLPLPLGPTHLAVLDWVKLAALGALGWWDVHLGPAWVAVAFGVPYFLIGAIQLAGSAKVESVALTFGLAWLLLLAPQARAMAAVLGVMYFIFYIGLCGYLSALPWNEPQRSEADKQKLARSAGWPFDALGPGRRFPKVTPVAAITAAALVAWCLYCIGTAFERLKGSAPGAGCASAIAFGGFTALIRLSIYVNKGRSPLSLAGRFGSGRWIIPSYDRIFLAPLAILFSIVLIVVVGYQPGVSPSAVVAAVAGVSLLIALAAGPSVRHWQLTAEHRLADPARSKRKQPSALAALR